MENVPLTADLEVPFSTEREAEIACGTLSVDQEPKRSQTKKSMSTKGCSLCVHFESHEAKSLRIAVNSFFDHLDLVVKTIKQFGPAAEKKIGPPAEKKAKT